MLSTEQLFSLWLHHKPSLWQTMQNWEWEQLLHPSTFELNDRTPLNDLRFIFLSIAIYVVFILLFKRLTQSLPAYDLRLPTLVHNFILAVGSLAMFLGLGYAVLLRFSALGLQPASLICQDVRKNRSFFFLKN
jgi:hypothetical protein